jgi:hypothetical protein
MKSGSYGAVRGWLTLSTVWMSCCSLHPERLSWKRWIQFMTKALGYLMLSCTTRPMVVDGIIPIQVLAVGYPVRILATQSPAQLACGTGGGSYSVRQGKVVIDCCQLKIMIMLGQEPRQTTPTLQKPSIQADSWTQSSILLHCHWSQEPSWKSRCSWICTSATDPDRKLQKFQDHQSRIEQVVDKMLKLTKDYNNRTGSTRGKRLWADLSMIDPKVIWKMRSWDLMRCQHYSVSSEPCFDTVVFRLCLSYSTVTVL